MFKQLHKRVSRLSAPLWLILLGLIPASLSARDFTYEGITYTVISEEDHTVKTKEGYTTQEILGYDPWGNPIITDTSHPGNTVTGELTIPSRVNDGTNFYIVKEIGKYGFYQNTVTSVTIPSSVTSIARVAFSGCSSLASISIPSSVTSIGDLAFSGCSSLASVSIPNSVTSIGNNAFDYCSSLASVSIPNSVTSIGAFTFHGCSSLASVSIPSSVTSIGDSAFSGCSSLTSVSIPSSVTSIARVAFSGCSSLASISIPSSVTSIGYRAFYFCSSLASVSIPNSVTSIGGAAFSGCSSLASVSIPNSVTSIDGETFYGCSSLASVSIPSSVTSIGNYAFSSCSSLASVSIPSSVTSIGDNAFRNCSALTSISIPNSVTSISNRTFANCSSLASVSIPNSVTSIGYLAFKDCSILTDIRIPDAIEKIGEDAFSGCPISELNFGKSLYSLGTTDGTSRKPAFSRSIFDTCPNLKTITVSDDNPYFIANKDALVIKPDSMMVYCPDFSRTSCTIPSTVSKFAANAFKNCNNLRSLTISRTVKEFADSLWYSCDSLRQVFYLAETPATAAKNIFNDVTYSKGTLYCPKNSMDKYYLATPWGWFEKMEAVNQCILNTYSITLEPGDSYQLTAEAITEDGRPFSYKWTSSNPAVASIDSKGLVTAIAKGSAEIKVIATDSEGNKLEASCDVTVKYNLSISHSAIHISADESFQLGIVSKLENLKINWNSSDPAVAYVNNCGLVTAMCELGECVVSAEVEGETMECTVNVGIDPIPEGVNYTTDKSSKTITITESPDAKGDIVIPMNVIIDGDVYTVTKLGERAFADAYKRITSIDVPNSVTEIAKHAFIHCENLSYLHLGSELKSIGEGALGFCKATVLECEAVTPPTLGVDCFWASSIGTLRVPAESVSAYNSAYGWRGVADTVEGVDFSSSRQSRAPEMGSVEPTAIIYESVTRDPDMLNVRLEPVGASTVIDWTSSNPEVATIDRGLITFLSKEGETVFGASTESGLKASSPSMSEETSAIGDVIAPETNRPNDIYNLQGICLKRNATEDDVKALRPGFYIIGGKKVIVK